VAKARDVAVDPDEPFGEAARRVLEVRADELIELVPAVRAGGGDDEPLHDLRVAARRLRAVLEVFEGAFPPNKLLREVKRHTERTGDARDLDVQIAFLEQFLEASSPSERPGIEWLIATLHAERATAYGALAPDLDRLENPRFRRRVQKLAGA
jgi:CHAD domain-containing protein